MAGVVFPTDIAWLDRSLLVGNILPTVTTDQVRCSAVLEMRSGGNPSRRFALVVLRLCSLGF